MKFELTETLRSAMHLHAEQEMPRECCGLVVQVGVDQEPTYQPCRNRFAGATDSDRFELDPEDFAEAADIGEVLAIVHSHPNASANPSMADRVGCERSGLPWLIVGWPSGVIKQLEPEGWQAPYKGRDFHHGVLDCYTLIQDWYVRELKIELPEIEREDEWWKNGADGKPKHDLYMQHFAAAGFVQVSGEPERHDAILMQVRSDVANHGAIYLGDGVMLHHLYDQLSREDPYGGYWAKHTLAIVRHISRIEPAQAMDVALKAAA